MINDILLDILAELKESLDPYDIPLIIGGGMGIYLRRKCLKEKRQKRYEKKVELRSTSDVDIFLTGEIIIDPEKISHLRDTLTDLGYTPMVEYLQFTKTITYENQPREVKIDILTSPPDKKDINKLKIKDFRVRPKSVNKFHAYLTEEAEGISIGIVPIDLSILYPDKNLKKINLYVPSRFNYIILKLNAFNDRINDEKTDYGRHHAYDIFASVTDMTEQDWKTASEHLQADKDKPYLKKTIEIKDKYFATETDLGIIRIKENVGFQVNKEIFDSYIKDFIEDMKDLFT